MRKSLAIGADGQIIIPAEMVRELAGNAREVMLEQRDSCIILSPLKVNLGAGNLPQLLAGFHGGEMIDALLEQRFKRGSAGPAQFQGDLEVLALNDVIMFIAASRKSGALVLDLQPRRAIFFVGGNIIFTTSDAPDAGFAAFLLRRQQIHEADLAAGLSHAAGGDPHAALRDAARMAPTEWEAARRLWTESIVFSAFHEKSGPFQFIDGELDRALHVASDYTATNFVMEGMRRIDEMARVKGQLPPPDAILRISEDISASIKLSPAEETLLKKVNGKRSVEETLLAAGLDEVDGAKALFTLVSTGIVQAVLPQLPEPPVPAAAPGQPAPSPALRLSGSLGMNMIEARKYLEVIVAFNDVFSAAYMALRLESGEKALIALNAFFKQNPIPFFTSVQFSPEGTLREDVLLKNLLEVQPDIRRDVLVQELNELLYFVLYAMKTGVSQDVERGIIEMARSLLKPHT